MSAALWRRGSRCLCLAALVMAPPARGQAVAARKVAASIERVFGRGALADSLQLEGSVVYRLTRADSLLGYAQVRNVKGKEQPITFLVAVDSGLSLRDIDILVYREPYGGEVAYESWRRQFRGKGPTDSLVVGRDIRSISGATISVNAVTLAVRRALTEFARWRALGQL